MIENLKLETQDSMEQSIAAFKYKLGRLRTGRAQPALVTHIMVDCYQQSMPLIQIANVVAEDSKTLAIQPYDPSTVSFIEKALRASDLDLNPATHGHVIRIILPPLTEERRIELVKLAKKECEQAKVSIRNTRRDTNQKISQGKKEKTLSDDIAKPLEDNIQKLTNEYIDQINSLLEQKEKELLSV